VNEGKVVAVGPGRRDKDGALLPLGAPLIARSAPRRSALCSTHTRNRARSALLAAVSSCVRAPSPDVPQRIATHCALGVAKGDRVLLPEYGGQPVKLNDVECVPHARVARGAWRLPRSVA
jgi:co-chaperonin GroES (HSP10)